ncbi:MAG: sugar phosphate isomerase/epimerase [Phycisphaerales bacterium]|nr:sugar phosphate isomerase/epimerase [Phycisphaerales bacterium]
MHSALNAFCFPPQTPLAEQARAAADAGFAEIELTGPHGLEDPALVRAALSQAGIRAGGVATAALREKHFASPEPADRASAIELVSGLLESAAAIGAHALVIIPAIVGGAQDARMQCGYLDALTHTRAALLALAPQAEACGVTLCIENAWNRFLLSPVDMADLIDSVNSPRVRVCFDVGNVMATGYPQDWIDVLGWRIARVHIKDYDLSRPGRAGFCPLGEGSVDWPAVMRALRKTNYDGPLVHEGPTGDLADAARRVQRLLDL